jgi:hypothetical protein
MQVYNIISRKFSEPDPDFINKKQPVELPTQKRAVKASDFKHEIERNMDAITGMIETKLKSMMLDST